LEVLEVSKRNGGADDFETRMRLLSELRVVGEPVLGEWMSCALHGAGRTSASQLKLRVYCEGSKSDPSHSDLSVMSRLMKGQAKGWRCEAANPHECQDVTFLLRAHPVPPHTVRSYLQHHIDGTKKLTQTYLTFESLSNLPIYFFVQLYK
jgi:hypothetical protein